MAGVLVTGYLLLLLFANFSPCQRLLAGIVEDVLADKLKTEVRIGRLELGLFNRVLLYDIQIKDKRNAELLTANLISAKIEYLPLLEGRVSVRTASLLDGKVRLYKETEDSRPNYQFVLDAFKSEKEEPSQLNLSLNSLILRRCELIYDEHYKPRTPREFTLSHINVHDLDANISLKKLTPDSINLRVRGVTLKEHSGLDVRNLSFRLAANKKKGTVSHFELLLPHSHFREDGLEATYDARDGETFLKSIRLSGQIADAEVALADVICFNRQLKEFPYTLSLTTNFDVRPEKIALSDLRLREKNEGLLNFRGQTSFFRRDGKVVRVSGIVENVQFKNGVLPRLLKDKVEPSVLAMIERLGMVTFSGNGDWQVGEESRFNGELNTEQGDIDGTVNCVENSYSARIMARDISLSGILGRSDLPDAMAFNADVRADIMKGRVDNVVAKLNVEHAQYRDYIYKGVLLDGEWHQHRLAAQLSSSDPNLDLDAKVGSYFDGRHFSDVKLEADVRKFAPQALNLPGRISDNIYSGQVSAAFPQWRSGILEGKLELQKFAMQNVRRPEEVYRLDYLHLTAQPKGRGTQVRLDSDFAQVRFDGSLALNELKQTLNNLVVEALPGMATSMSGVQPSNKEWRLKATLYKPDFFKKVLNLPLDFEAPVEIQGQIVPSGRRSNLVASAPVFTYGSTSLRNATCYLTGDNGNLSVLLKGTGEFRNADARVELSAQTSDGKVVSQLAWGEESSRKFYGELKTVSDLSRSSKGKINVNTSIQPTSISINDSVWNVSSSNVSFVDGLVEVNGVRLSHADQSLAVNGRLSADSSDSLQVTLDKVDVGYLMSLIKLKPVSFAGKISGVASLHPDASGVLNAQADVTVPDFLFNDCNLGKADIKLGFRTDNQRLRIKADIHKEDEGYTKVRGYVGIGEKALQLDVESKNTPLGFMNRYLDNFLADIDGRTTGHCRIHGSFKYIDFEGEEKADVSAKVRATGCHYIMKNGTVNLSLGRMRLSGFELTDHHGGEGTLNGEVVHNYLKDMEYDFNIRTDRLKIYDKVRSLDMPFYATAFGSGMARLYGKPGELTLDAVMDAEKGTLITYVVENRDGGQDVSLLTFGEKSADHDAAHYTSTHYVSLPNHIETPVQPQRTTDIRMNLQVNMTPGAALKVITDEKAGNYLSLYGTGTLNASWYNKGTFQMNGPFSVQGGTYKMVIQDVIHKDFKIDRGGTVEFKGDPFESDLNLRAIYTIPSVSLADLGLNFSDKAVRADCILNLTGKAKQPQVAFDLDFPKAGEEIKQMVFQLITSEEDMNMQAIYLLGMGRFYNYNFAASEAAASGQDQSSVAMKSFLSSTLSGQINNLITNAVGTSNWTFGANVATGEMGWSDMEVGGLLSGRLFNNRLLVNGNFGYRERTYSNTNFVGDFDINYLLTPSGSFSVKAYSETNDRYFSKSSMTTQGVGLQAKREFNSIRDLFAPRKKEEKEEKKASTNEADKAVSNN